MKLYNFLFHRVLGGAKKFPYDRRVSVQTRTCLHCQMNLDFSTSGQEFFTWNNLLVKNDLNLIIKNSYTLLKIDMYYIFIEFNE